MGMSCDDWACQDLCPASTALAHLGILTRFFVFFCNSSSLVVTTSPGKPFYIFITILYIFYIIIFSFLLFVQKTRPSFHSELKMQIKVYLYLLTQKHIITTIITFFTRFF